MMWRKIPLTSILVVFIMFTASCGIDTRLVDDLNEANAPRKDGSESSAANDIQAWLAANEDTLGEEINPDTGLPYAPEGQEHLDNPKLGNDDAYVFFDDALDEVICSDGSPTSDPPVDILEVSVLERDGGVEVRVRMKGSAINSAKDYSLSIQARIGKSTKDGGRGFQVGIYEFHDGQPRIGLLETVEDVEEGTDHLISAEDDVVTFFFPDTTMEPGETVTARSFHLSSSADQKTCDQTPAFDPSEIAEWFVD